MAARSSSVRVATQVGTASPAATVGVPAIKLFAPPTETNFAAACG